VHSLDNFLTLSATADIFLLFKNKQSTLSVLTNKVVVNVPFLNCICPASAMANENT
jgi:hypothetical protein